WPVQNVGDQTVVDTFWLLQPNMLQALGWQALHAGAAIGPAGAVAFCGISGSGKSTLAFAMQQAGWRQVADDAVVLRIDRNGVRACPIPFTPRLRPASGAYFAGVCRTPIPLAGAEGAEYPLAATFVLRQDSDRTTPLVSLLPQ